MKNHSIILTGLLFLLATSCTKKQAQPAPVAAFNIIYTNDVAPAKISFENNSSQALTYTWDFGNGETSQEENPEHIYMNPGTYHVTLIARNGSQSTQVTKQITIQQPYSKGKIVSVKITKIPATDSGSNWDFDGTTPDIYFRIYNSSGNIIYTAPTYYIDPQTLPLQFNIANPVMVSPLSSIISLEVLDYDSGLATDIMGGISFALSIAQANLNDPYPASWTVDYGGVAFELGLQWE